MFFEEKFSTKFKKEKKHIFINVLLLQYNNLPHIWDTSF